MATKKSFVDEMFDEWWGTNVTENSDSYPKYTQKKEENYDINNRDLNRSEQTFTNLENGTK